MLGCQAVALPSTEQIVLQFISHGQKCDFHKMADIEKEGMCHLMARAVNIKGEHFIFHLYTLFSCMKKSAQSCRYVGLSGHSSAQ